MNKVQAMAQSLLAQHAEQVKQYGKLTSSQRKLILREVSAQLSERQLELRLSSDAAGTIEARAQALLESGRLDDVISPSVTLLATASDDSQRAFEALNGSNSFFTVEPGAPGGKDAPPIVIWADDRFVGLPAILALVETLAEIDADAEELLDQGGIGLTAPDPALARAMSKALDHNHQEAQSALRRVMLGAAVSYS